MPTYEQIIAAKAKCYHSNEPCKYGHIGMRNEYGRCCICVKDAWRKSYKKKKNSQKPWVSLREHAKKKGETFYFTGKPCKRGHIAKRFVCGWTCVECLNERRKAIWSDPDKKKKYLKKCREWSASNHMKKASTAAAWRKNNPDKVRDLVKNGNRNRRARRNNAGGRFNESQVRDLFIKQHEKCAFCFKKITMKTLHRDHVTPLTRGGSNYISNIQLLCPPCNLKKRNKDPIQFAQENGRLL